MQEHASGDYSRIGAARWSISNHTLWMSREAHHLHATSPPSLWRVLALWPSQMANAIHSKDIIPPQPSSTPPTDTPLPSAPHLATRPPTATPLHPLPPCPRLHAIHKAIYLPTLRLP